MTDPQQAARIAAMRARRGQAPIEISTSTVAASSSAPTPTTLWAPPTVAATTAPIAPVAASRAAATGAPVTSAARSARPARSARRRHAAAASRIVATGLATSSVFVLIGVMGAAARPDTPAADTPTSTDPLATTPTATPAPTTAAGADRRAHVAARRRAHSPQPPLRPPRHNSGNNPHRSRPMRRPRRRPPPHRSPGRPSRHLPRLLLRHPLPPRSPASDRKWQHGMPR